jgi:signal transduction histidine kinase
MAEQLAASENERRTLIGNIANELRTPLTMLKENIEGLLDGNFARDDAHLNLILGETIRLSRLVEDMRMLALAESRGLILHREPTDLNALVRETVELYHRDASAHNVGLHAVVGEERLVAHVDPLRIKQVIGILIDGALVEKLKSDIRVEVSNPEPEDDKAQSVAQIEVAYRAEVISPEELRSYFDRFYQRDTSVDGTGLGLAIAKLLVQAHGGEISVSSEARRGTQVRFTLPAETEVSQEE